MSEQKRVYERIPVEIPCRLFIPEEGKKQALRFEAFCHTQNLGLGGVFLVSTFLLKPRVELRIELSLPSGPLEVKGRIAHVIDLENSEYPSGMGIEFLGVDSQAREVLLRYFTPERYQSFYASMTKEFSHLRHEFEQTDVSLLLNLWEEWKIRQAGGPSSIEDGAPGPLTRRRR